MVVRFSQAVPTSIHEQEVLVPTLVCRLVLTWPGVGMSHLSGEVKRLMSTLTKFDQDNYPEMLGRICIITHQWGSRPSGA